ncbi:hypothetical protein ABVT39_026197 [Epinephelus coioides]
MQRRNLRLQKIVTTHRGNADSTQTARTMIGPSNYIISGISQGFTSCCSTTTPPFSKVSIVIGFEEMDTETCWTLSQKKEEIHPRKIQFNHPLTLDSKIIISLTEVEIRTRPQLVVDVTGELTVC